MISKEKINMIVQKISAQTNPDKIILFGSYAKGGAEENSDLDICVIIGNNDIDKRYLSRKIRSILYGELIPIDIIVYSQKEIDEWRNVKMAFPTIIMRTGKVLYEK